MKNLLTRHVGSVLVLAGTALLALGGIAWAHPAVTLKDASGAVIVPDGNGVGNAYSARETCGTCHDYNAVEKHSYHSQLGANEQLGWANWNPDSPSGYKSGPAPKGKSWVQSPGHVGKW